MTGYTPGFDELAGDEASFFADRFGRLPLYRPAALRGDPGELLSVADLDGLLYLEAIRPPYLRVMRDGVMVPHLTFTVTSRVHGADVTDMVIPERVYELAAGGATITWPALNQSRPNIRALTRLLASKFSVETNATAFFAPAGSRGMRPQHTFFDMFVIQLDGQARWTVWERPPARRADAGHHERVSLGEPGLEVSLCPGDVLYLPWGTPHEAAPAEAASLHLSVMLRIRLWSDLLRQTVRGLLTRGSLAGTMGRPAPLPGVILADPAPLAARPALPDPAALLAERSARLARQLRELDPTEQIRHLIAAGQLSPGSAQGTGFQLIAAR